MAERDRIPVVMGKHRKNVDVLMHVSPLSQPEQVGPNKVETRPHRVADSTGKSMAPKCAFSSIERARMGLGVNVEGIEEQTSDL